MANQQLEAFIKRCRGDNALLERLTGCSNLNAIAAIGADLVKHQAIAAGVEPAPPACPWR